MPSAYFVVRATVTDPSWPDVTRTREILVLAEEFGGA